MNIVTTLARRLTIASLLIAATSPSSWAQNGPPPTPEGWSFTLGAGAFYSPNYQGDDDSQVSIFPNLRLTYADRFFASVGEGIGGHIIHNESWKIGPVLKYRFSRDDDGSRPFGTGDDTDDLRGLGDVDGTAELGAFAQYNFDALKGKLSSKLELRQGLGGHQGFVADLNLRYNDTIVIGEQRIRYSIGPEVQYTSSQYNDTYFGVNNSQSVASGLSPYDANEGTLSYGFGGSLIIPHCAKVSTIIVADYTRLGDTIADSSLVSERGSADQFSFGLVLNYTF